ncbi:MAG: flagellar FlbD family protein [Eubacteriales bacterium]|nr:flagellar FlbD family protein [Eubacteriales bacterium]
MIEVTRLKGSKMTINAELIELVEETPDTVITLTNGKKYVVNETCSEIIDLVICYKRKIFADGPTYVGGE